MFRALRVFKADGRRFFPGEEVPNAHTWKNLSLLMTNGYLSGFHEETESDVPASDAQPDIDALREEAKALGIRVTANMKAETIANKIAEAKANQADDTTTDASDESGGAANDVDLLGESGEQQS